MLILSSQRALRILRSVKFPLAIAVVIGTITILQATGTIPHTSSLLNILTAAVERWGILVVAAISFIENVVFLTAAFPGSVAILVSMAATHGDVGRAMTTFMAIVLPSFAAHYFNFACGRGWIRLPVFSRWAKTDETASHKVEHPAVLFLSTLWHPQLAAVTTARAGQSGFSLALFTFYFIPVALLWNAIWGIAMYSGGVAVSQSSIWEILFWLYLFMWAVRDARAAAKAGGD